jgi:glucose-6-phosphate dehydrogenase assembly protein OpcA
MDDTEKPPAPPRPDEVEALQTESPPSATPLHDTETRPSRPGAQAPSASVLPPLEDTSAGQHTPPTPGDTTGGANIQTTEMTPGVERSIATTNLDAIAQAGVGAVPDHATAEALESIVEGGTVPVAVNEINRALIEVWKSTTEGGAHEGKVSVTLMRAMNMVVYVENEDRAQEVTQVISRVTGRHPCRTIMIVNQCDPNEPASGGESRAADAEDLDASMSAHCQIASAAGKKVCCEQITITARTTAALYRASTIALNLLITDLPVFLWWASGMPLNNVVLANLEDSIDRLVVDSESFTDPLAGLLALARAVDANTTQNQARRYAPSDLDWDRLLGWREATAHFFDHREYTPSVWRIGTAEIQYAAPGAGAEPNPVAALLYAGWLAMSLGWEFHTAALGRGGPGDFVLTMHQGMRPIPIIVRAVQAESPEQPGLLSVRLTTNDINPVNFQMAPAPDGMFIDCVIAQEGTELARYKVRYPLPDEAGLLDSELEVFGADPVFEQALAAAGTMAWASLPLRRRSDLSSQFGGEQRKSSVDPRFAGMKRET